MTAEDYIRTLEREEKAFTKFINSLTLEQLDFYSEYIDLKELRETVHSNLNNHQIFRVEKLRKLKNER